MHHEFRKPTDVLGRAATDHLDDPLGNGVDEVAVVAHEQDRSLVAGELSLKPCNGVGVEVVGRFIEYEHLGTRQHQPGKRGPHPPSAREFAKRAIRVGVGEAETGQDAPSLRLEPVAPELFESRLQLAVGVQRPVAFRSLRRGDGVEQPAEFGFEVTNVVGSRQHLIKHGPGVFRQHLLGEVADPQPLGSVNLAPVGILEAYDDLEQRGLSNTVTAHQGDATPRQQPKRDIGKQGSVAMSLGDAGDGDHEGTMLWQRHRLAAPGPADR